MTKGLHLGGGVASLTEVLATIDARLAALDTERAELVTARAALARIVGAPVPETTSPPAPQAGRRARPTNERDDRILALLQTPQKTPDLAKRLGLTDAAVVQAGGGLGSSEAQFMRGPPAEPPDGRGIW